MRSNQYKEEAPDPNRYGRSWDAPEQTKEEAQNMVYTNLRVERYKQAMAMFFQRVNSTLAGKTVPMKWLDSSYAYQFGASTDQSIAFTDGESVFINAKFFRDSIEASVVTGSMVSAVGPIARVKGASYHELAHILYTPRQNAQPLKNILERQREADSLGMTKMMFTAFNVLEDQRIETRFVANYKTAINYFVPMVAEFLFGKKSDPADAHSFTERKVEPQLEQIPGLIFPVVYGRKFLPPDLIKLALDEHKAYIAEKSIENPILAKMLKPQQLMAWIDEYLTLVFPSDSVRGEEIVSHVATYLETLLLNNGNRSDNTPQYDPNSKHATTRGTPQRTADQRGSLEGVYKMIEDLGEELKKSDSEGAEGKGEGKGKGKDKDGEAKDSGGKSPSNSKPDSGNGNKKPSEPSAGAGKGDGSSDGPNSAMESALYNRILEIYNESTAVITKDAFDVIKNINRQLNKARKSVKPNLRNSRVEPTEPSMIGASREIRDKFMVIRADHEDVWEHRRASGKLNVNELMMSRRTHFEIFDEWDDKGEDATSMEVVILVDQSSSMDGFKIRSVSSALWIIRHACISLGIPVTAIGYDGSSRLLFSPDCPIRNDVQTVLHSSGGTDPLDALEWAASIFQSSEAKHKFLFSLTDGQWYLNETLKTVMAEMRSLDVDMSLIVQGEPNYRMPTEMQASKDFMYDLVPEGNYGHHRTLRSGHAVRDLPKIISKALESKALDSVR